MIVGEGRGRAVRANVHVERADVGFRARIESDDGTRRELEGESCQAVADAAAVVLALAAVQRPEAEEAAPSLEATSVDEERVAPNSPSTDRDHVPFETFTRRRWLLVGGAMLFGSGSLPGVDLGGTLSLAMRPRRLYAAVELGVAGSQNATLPGRDAGATFSQLRGNLRGCWLALDDAWGIGPCAGIGFDRTHGEGFGSNEQLDATSVVAVASLGGLLTWMATSRLGVRATVDGATPITRPTYVIERAGAVHRASTVALRSSLGVDFYF